MHGNNSSSDVTTDSDYDSSNTDAHSDSGSNNINNTRSTRNKKRRRNSPTDNNDMSDIMPTQTGFIPPALLFIVAPIMFVCFIAYGVSSPNNHNAGLLPATPLLQKKHTEHTQFNRDKTEQRKMLATTVAKAKSLESNFNVYSNDKKTVRHLRHAVNAIHFVNDVKKKHVHNIYKNKKKKDLVNKEHQQKDDHNHGTHPPRPKHLTLKLFIAKHDDGAEKKKESTKKKLQAGPPKPDSGPILTSLNIGGLRGIIAAITGGATGNNNFMAQRATGGSGNLRHKKQQQITNHE